MSVRKIKGSYWVDFRAKYRRVRKRSPVQTVAGTKDYESLLRSRPMRGEPLEGKAEAAPQKFSDFAWEWFETYVRANNKDSEQYHKAICLRVHLVPFFGRMLIQDIGPAHVEAFKARQRAKGLNDRTTNHHLTCLVKCLRCAHEWGRIPAVPKVAKIKVSLPPFDFLTPPESERLLAYARANDRAWHDIILLALRTGMRRGELLGLQWGDVDLDRGKITVRHSIVRGILTCPKNFRYRHIPMNDEVREMLAARPQGLGFVFTAESGLAKTKSTIDRNLTRICREAGMRHIHWHVFRHTFASQLVTAGVPLNVVQGLMGHSDIMMTMRYSHFVPSLYDSVVNVLDAIGKEGMAKNLGQRVGNRAQIAAPAACMENTIFNSMQQQKRPSEESRSWLRD